MGQGNSLPGPYQRFINPPPIEDHLEELRQNPDAVVLELLLDGLNSINSSSAMLTATDPFVAIKLQPADPLLGDQLQTSSIKPATQSPRWEPAERFRFYISNPAEGKLFFAIRHYEVRHPSEPEDLGFAVLPLRDFIAPLETGACHITREFDIVDPSTGTPHGNASFRVKLLSLSEALSERHEAVYEYQRWQPIRGWGNSKPGHLLPTDPGSWSSGDGLLFGLSLEEVAPPVPDGWEMTQVWTVQSTHHDKDGWQYTMDFNSPFWHTENNRARFFVRRRPLVRELRKSGTFTRSQLAGGGERDVVFTFLPTTTTTTPST